MKGFAKTTTTLVLIIIFLSALLIAAVMIFAAAWLHTYRVFTRETPVAEVAISEQKEDELGPYVEVTVTPIEADVSALSKLFVSDSNFTPKDLESKEYKLYGDTVYIGGPILKFENGLILLNFQTAYKLNSIFARYDADFELENNRTSEMKSNYQIGESDATYRNIANDMRKDNIKGKIYKIFFDSEPQMKPTGIFVGDEPLTGEVVIKNDGFFWKVDEE